MNSIGKFSSSFLIVCNFCMNECRIGFVEVGSLTRAHFKKTELNN